ncbi:MAG TPA: hypothetical protein VHS06_04845, partial [Chloroflexota bacterium]|nr:hypothetical protein [Chloroflexota bacterium]
MKKRSFVILLAIAAVPLLLGVSGGTPSSPGYRFARQSAPYTETVAAWMAQNSVEKVAETLTVSPASVEQVRSVFRLMGRRLGTLPSTTSSSSSGIVQPVSVSSEPLPSDRDLAEQQPAVEERIQRQVATVLHRRGVGFKVGDGSFLFPPVLFRFRDLPDLLVVSPRSRIERLGTVLLTPNMPLTDAVKLEGEVSSGGYSALVTHIGGLGVYPSMVPDNSDLRWTTRTVAHEWAHQFLALRPLGWRYAFGAERDPRMVMLNETAAEVIGRE